MFTFRLSRLYYAYSWPRWHYSPRQEYSLDGLAILSIAIGSQRDRIFQINQKWVRGPISYTHYVSLAPYQKPTVVAFKPKMDSLDRVHSPRTGYESEMNEIFTMLCRFALTYMCTSEVGTLPIPSLKPVVLPGKDCLVSLTCVIQQEVYSLGITRGSDLVKLRKEHVSRAGFHMIELE